MPWHPSSAGTVLVCCLAWEWSAPRSSRHWWSPWQGPGESSEVLGWKHSLNDSVLHARKFYWLYGLAVVGGAAIVLFSTNLINLAVNVEVMNAMLLPIVLGSLLILEARVLPPADRMKSWHRAFVWFSAGLISALGIYTLVVALLGM